MQLNDTPPADAKTCTKCGETKPETEFCRQPQGQGGLSARCKNCLSTYQAEWYAANRERVAKNNKAWQKANPDRTRASSRRHYVANREKEIARSIRANAAWRLAHPEQARLLGRIHATIKRAVKQGILTRPATCEACGQASKIEAAHSDYSRPLDVKWLCRSCHTRWDSATPKLPHH